jgi:excisionase family DNA binding protein
MLTVQQAAKRFRVSSRLVRRWIAQGRLPAQKMGKVWILNEAAVKHYQKVRRRKK